MSTGIEGLDDILGGGLPQKRLYLIQGDPGTGKTTLALQYLFVGRDAGEKVLYVTLSESAAEIQDVALSHGWSLEGVHIKEYSPDQQLAEQAANSVFHPSEIELGETIRAVLGEIVRLNPSRVVFDSLSELRLLAGESLRYRREILSLKNHFASLDCTVMLLDDKTTEAGDRNLQSLCHGVISLETRVPEYGSDRHYIRISKLRGVNFRGGYHDYVIKTGGLQVYPRLIAAEHGSDFEQSQIGTGIAALDTLLGGGLDRGTTCILIGPSGSGKSSIAMQFAVTSAERDERVAIFLFEEALNVALLRTSGLGIPLKSHIDADTIEVRSIDPAEVAPNEFAQLVRDSVERRRVRMVIIDSLTAYYNAMPDERSLMLQLHELLSYLSQQGVTSVVVSGQHGMLTASPVQAVDVSYLADTVLLFRYYEHAGSIHKALSVFKRRGGKHEPTIRQLRLGEPHGISLSAPLRNFRGLLTGVPVEENEDENEPGG